MHSYIRARRSAGATWEKLIKRLVWIDPNKIEAIALDAVGESGEPRPDDNAFSLDSSTIWTLLGGMEGLEALEKNCQVLVELTGNLQAAFGDYAQRAVTTYYFMTRHVLELYDRAGFAGLAELQSAL